MYIRTNGYNRFQDLQAPYTRIVPSSVNLFGLTQVPGGYGYTLCTPNTEDELLPYLVNDIGYHAKQMHIPNCTDLSAEVIRDYKNTIDTYTVNLPNTFNMCIIYTNHLEDTNNWLPEDYEEIVEDETDVGVAIAQFKNVMQRLFEDEGYDWNIDYKFFKSDTKHSLIAVSNNCYMRQHRIEYFTLALSQLVFPELYESFIQEEKDVYAEILHQMILKRIVRTRIQDKANVLSDTTKYTNYFSERNITRTLDLLVRQRIQSLKDNMERYHNQARDLLNQYTEAVTNFNNASQELETKEANSKSEVEELKTILNQPYVSDVRINGNTMYFTLQSYLDYYDTDLLDCVLNGLDTDYTEDENYSIFLNEVFKNQHYKLRVQSNFQYQLTNNNNNRDYGIRVNQDDYDASLNNRLCNPHLQFYNCLGSYAAQLAKAQAEGNLAVFIGLALASTRSINFADGAVNHRLKDEFNPDGVNILDRKCLEDEEGNLYTIKEVIDKVKYPSPVIEPQDTLTPEEREAEFVW